MGKNCKTETASLVSHEANTNEYTASKQGLLSALQVVGGGALVFVAALIFGNA